MTASDDALARVVRALETAYTELATLAETTEDVPPELSAARGSIGDLLIRLQTAALARRSSVDPMAIADSGGRVRLRIKALKPKPDESSTRTAIVPLTAVPLEESVDVEAPETARGAAPPTGSRPPPIPPRAVTPSLVERLRKVQPSLPEAKGAVPEDLGEPMRQVTDGGVLARDAQVRLAQLEAELDKFSRALASPVRQQPALAAAETRARPQMQEPVTEVVVVKRTSAPLRGAPPKTEVAPRVWIGPSGEDPDEATVEIRGGRDGQSSPPLRRSKD